MSPGGLGRRMVPRPRIECSPFSDMRVRFAARICRSRPADGRSLPLGWKMISALAS